MSYDYITAQDGWLLDGSSWVGGQVPPQTEPYASCDIQHTMGLADQDFHATRIGFHGQVATEATIVFYGIVGIFADAIEENNAHSNRPVLNYAMGHGNCVVSLEVATIELLGKAIALFDSDTGNADEIQTITIKCDTFTVNNPTNTSLGFWFNDDNSGGSPGDSRLILTVQGLTGTHCAVVTNSPVLVMPTGYNHAVTLAVNTTYTSAWNSNTTLGEVYGGALFTASGPGIVVTVNGTTRLVNGGAVMCGDQQGVVIHNGDVQVDDATTPTTLWVQASADPGTATLNGRITGTHVNAPRAKDVRYGVGSGTLHTTTLSSLRDFTNNEKKQIRKALGITGDTVATEATGELQVGNTILAAINSLDGKTAQQALRYMLSMLAGSVAGAGTATEVFYAPNGTTKRVSMAVDVNGNRTPTYDP